MSQVEIGYLEETETWRLESPHFPSKTGGKPSWLSLADLPTFEDLQCETCKQQTVFLCQIYAPLQENDDNFHRTLFIFICKTASCNVKDSVLNYRVFRSNLARDNKFYSYEPAPESKVVFETAPNLCALCGCPGTKKCSKCKTFYCCREHQVIDWKESHKATCGLKTISISKYLYPEFEIQIETEEINAEEVNEAKALEDFNELKAKGQIGTLHETDESELEKFASCEEDEAFTRFKERIKSSPDQILRYKRNGEPLWITKEQPVAENIPSCEYCGAARIFEFQIMPQLLVQLEMDYDLEFGILAVYTCEKSCGKDGYKKEYIFKQNGPTEKM